MLSRELTGTIALMAQVSGHIHLTFVNPAGILSSDMELAAPGLVISSISGVLCTPQIAQSIELDKEIPISLRVYGENGAHGFSSLTSVFSDPSLLIDMDYAQAITVTFSETPYPEPADSQGE